MLALLIMLAAGQADLGPPIVVEGQKPAEEKKICRTERETGSRMVREVCKSVTERKADQTRALNAIRMGNRSTNPEEAFQPPRDP